MREYFKSRIRSTFSRWFVSYLAILMIPVLFGVVIYYQALNNVEKQNEYVQEQTLMQVSQNFDAYLDLVYNTAYGIATSEMLEMVVFPENEGTYSPSQILKIRTLKDQIINMKNIDDRLEGIYVYFPNTDHILSTESFGPLDWTEKDAMERYGMGLEEARQLAEQDNFRGGLNIAGEQGERLTYSYVHEVYSGSEESRIVILISMDYGEIRKMLTIHDVFTLLVWEDGRCFLAEESGCREADHAEFAGEKDAYVVSEVVSERYGFSYMSYMPRELFLSSVNLMKWILAAYVTLCLLVGIVALWWITRKNYLPVKDLLEVVVPRTEALPTGQQDHAGEELSLVKKSWLELRDAYQREREQNRTRIQSERNLLISELTSGRIMPKVSEDTKQWFRQIPFDSFCLIGIEIRGEETEENADQMDISFFVVQNVLHEILESRYYSSEAIAHGMLLGIVSRKQKYEGEWDTRSMSDQLVQKDIRMRLEELAHFLKVTYQMDIQVSISSSFRGERQLENAFEDIRLIQDYRSQNASREEFILSVDGIDFKEQELQYHKKCRDITKLMSEHKVKEAIRQLSDLIPEEMAATGSYGWEASKAERLFFEVKKYIEEHFCENMLTVGYLSDKFETSVSYLSREFKKRNGLGILEYINKLRLEKAKQLLREQYPVRDVALMVGFFDTQPLVRLFKQVEGITPSEYRSSLKSENH